MAEYMDNMADPPDWADVETNEVIRADSIGPVGADVVARVAERDQHEWVPAPEAR